MAGKRVSDKVSFKVLWAITGMLAGLCIFFIKEWYVDINLSKKVCAQEIITKTGENKNEIIKNEKRIIVLETIIPEIRNFMQRLDYRMRNLENKK